MWYCLPCGFWSLSYAIMSNIYRNWNVLCWNVRGLNSEARQRAVRQKIEESQCSIACLQETKCTSFDSRTIKSFCPKRFDSFVCSPSIGASGGLLITWNGSLFEGEVIFQNRFSLSISFTSLLCNQSWVLTNI